MGRCCLRRSIPGLLSLVFSLPFASPAQAAWQEARSKHFIIYADERPDELLAYARKLERFDQAVRTVRKMKDPELTDAERLTIYVLPTTGAIASLAGGGSVAGFYLPRVRGSTAFVPRLAGVKGDDFDLDPDSIFFHEYSHHLQLQSADVAVPPWVTEGFAEFFAKTELRDDGTVVIGLPPTYRAWSLFEYNSLSITRMVSADTDLSATDEEGVYSRGWLLLHYLTFNPARRGQLDSYLSAIQQGVPPLTAAQRAFGDLVALSNELGGYLRQKSLPTIVMRGLAVPTATIAIRALSPGEADMMRVHIRSEAAPNHRQAMDIAADARKIAEQYPSDPFVQTSLAQAEFDAKNYAAAEAAADKALALEPTRLKALLYKGKAEMELAHPKGGAADWSGIRQWFLKANKVDPEAAEPLMLFYKSFVYAGETPSKNAVSALFYSLTLVPQDSRVRLMAVDQLLSDGDLPGAKRYFAAFAFEPHGRRDVRTAAASAMAAISSGQRDEAVKDLAQIEKLMDKDD